MNIETIICNRTKPPPMTADAACIAIDDRSQKRFLCKDQKTYSWLPMAELLCQRLARKCSIVVPECYMVELATEPGKYLFGSQWEGGAEDWSPGIEAKVTNPQEFSKIFAFDLLVHNVDRHPNNYLYLQLAGDTVLKAMDHSRTWWFSGWPLPPPPPERSSNTMTYFSVWNSSVAWQDTSAFSVIEAWLSLDRSDFVEIIAGIPEQWSSCVNMNALINWWGSTEWTRRAESVKTIVDQISRGAS